jgi:hypothetical protein
MGNNGLYVLGTIQMGGMIVNSGGSVRYGDSKTLIYGWAANPDYRIELQTNNTIRLKLNNTKTEILNSNLTINELRGTGNAYACLDYTGKLYRSATACS